MENNQAPGPTPAETSGFEAPNTGSIESTVDDKKARRTIFFVVLGAILLLAGLIIGVIFLAQDSTRTGIIRDIFIIFLALEFLLIGAALVVLIVQIARLTALLENEIQPILSSTTETINTLRGTTTFLSNQLVNPVVKTYSSLSAVRRVMDLFTASTHKHTKEE